MRHAILYACVAVVVAIAGPGSTRAGPPTADSMALSISDSEALYTLTGGLKPISEGFWRTRFAEDQNTSAEVDAARSVLNSLPLGPDLEAGVYVFAAPFGGKRSASAFVAHRPSLRALIERRSDVFEPLGVTSATSPQKVMELIDRASPAARWRGFGLVFGYPDYAVEFFVAAGEEQAETGKFVEREFRNLPTFASDRGRFVYAVPKGHVDREEDRDLKAKTEAIFQSYPAWRSAFVGDGKAGAVVLLRYWLAPPIPCPPTPAVAPASAALVACPDPWGPCHQPRRRVVSRCRTR